MLIPERHGNSESYRYGFNSHEKDDEIAGVGNQLSFGNFGYNPRIGRRWNLDPQWQRMPGQSPYSVNNNSPISHYDPDGEFAQFIAQYGINVGINIMTQMLTAYMLDPNVDSWSEAWDKTSLLQAFGEGAVDMIGTKKLRMAANAVMGMATYIGQVGFDNVTTEGLMTSGMIGLLEPIVGDAISKYGAKVVANGLLKMGFDTKYIRKITGGLSDKEVRSWYSEQVKKININIEPTEANARMIVNKRNFLKQQARDLMSNRKKALELDKFNPIRDYDYYYNKYYEQGYRGEALYKRIMEGGATPNANVNKQLGIDK